MRIGWLAPLSVVIVRATLTEKNGLRLKPLAGRPNLRGSRSARQHRLGTSLVATLNKRRTFLNRVPCAPPSPAEGDMDANMYCPNLKNAFSLSNNRHPFFFVQPPRASSGQRRCLCMHIAQTSKTPSSSLKIDIPFSCSDLERATGWRAKAHWLARIYPP